MTLRISFRSLFAITIMIIIGWMIYQAIDAILMFLTAAILATGLHQCAVRLAARLPGGRKVWLAAIVAGILALLVGLGWSAGPQIVANLGALQNSLSKAWTTLSSIDFVRELMGNPADGDDLAARLSERLETVGNALTQVVTAVTNTISALVLIAVLTLFLVWNPDLYEKGFLALFPARSRSRMSEVITAIGDALWHWLRGQAVAMVIIGVLTGLGLWLIDMQFAILLGVIAGLFQIIPYVGPILSAIPGITLALAASPQQALWVAAVYLGVQALESNLITPMVLKSEASLPPVLTLFATVALGLIFGPLGFIIASPLALVGLVLFRELYNDLVLGDP